MNPKKIPTLKMTALFLALIVVLIPFGMAFAAEGISATLTAAEGEFTVGDPIPMILTVTHPNGYRVLPLQFQDSTWGELEIREVAPPQVVANPDGSETTTQTIYATLWATGKFATSELSFGVSDTAGEIHEISAAPLGLNIASVLAEGDTELRDIKPQASLPLPAIWPWVVGGLLVVLDNLTQLHGQIPGSLEILRHPTDLQQWLPEVIAPWKAAAQSKGLSWQAEIVPELPIVDIDADRMAQAVGNLLSNAVKYTPTGGQVKISVSEESGKLKISVQDTGPGIDPAEMDQIFEPFYRSNRETRFPQGMGLGLAIAREIVSAHEGEIKVQSERGRGSIFEIMLEIH